MKRLLLLCSAPLALLLLIGLVPAVSQDGEKPAEGGDEIEAWKKANEPGEAHAVIARMAGNWTLDFKMWMPPGPEPTEIKSASTLKAVFGGRYIRGTYAMEAGPIPHTGEFWFGHSNQTRKYQFIRLTDMDTTMRIYEGDYDAKKKQLALKAEYSMDWQGQTFKVKERNVYTFHSDDKFVLEVFSHYEGMPNMPDEGIKEIEITYTRAKEKAPATQDPHGILKKLRGDFSVDMKMWFAPGAEPVTLAAPVTYDWTLDGQAIVMEYSTDMEAMPHKGIEYISYNEVSGEYESIRMTSMSGAMMVWRGKYDPAKKTLEFAADISGVVNGEKFSGRSRAVYKWESDDKYTATVFSKYDGMEEEIKEVEMTFTRNK